MRKLTLFLLAQLAVYAADVAGQWTIHVSLGNQEVGTTRLELKTEGNRITGSANGMKVEGSVDGDHLLMTVKRENGDVFARLDGRIQGDQMQGTAKQGNDDLTWTARRIAVSAGPPQTHVFEPKEFHRQFSGLIPPALTIRPGDTVKTWTVDAGGVDQTGAHRSGGGNPETGPFYVEGAVPGDTLAVKFTRIRLNRDSAQSGDRIVPSAVSPGYFRSAKFDANFDSTWTLDQSAGVAKLAKPTEKLKNFKVKLRPMIGCVGVAPPANQAFRSGWLGPWGGNMDYNGVREGVTVYLPVYQEGALLFVGDGHALQGDGELNGDALETSMDVEFTVDVIRGKTTQAPRFEDSEYLMASGIAGSLPDALQQATTELARWIERDYGLSATESNIVLGAAIRYDIAEVVDPQIHVVAKIAKDVLAPLK